MSCLVSSLVTCEKKQCMATHVSMIFICISWIFQMIFNQHAVCCWPDRPIYSPKALKPQLQLEWHTQSTKMSRAMASSKKTVSSFPPGLTCLLSITAKPPISCSKTSSHPLTTWDVFECSGSCGQKVLPVFLSTSPSIALALHMIWYLFIASCWHFFGHLLPQELDQFPSGWGTKFKDIEHKPLLVELIKSKHGSQTVANQVVLWPGNFQLDSLMSPTIFLPHQKEQTWKSLSFQKNWPTSRCWSWFAWKAWCPQDTWHKYFFKNQVLLIGSGSDRGTMRTAVFTLVG